MTRPHTEQSTSAEAEAGLVVDYAALRSTMSAFGLRLASNIEIDLGVAVAEDLVGQDMVSTSTVQNAQEYTGCSAWVCGDPVEGVLLFVPLSQAGERAVRNGTFNPGAGLEEHYCRYGEECFGVYVGVYAGRTREARGALMRGCATARVSVFGSVPCFARAATEDGARSMTSLGFHPAGFGAKDLWLQEPVARANRKVA